MTTARTSILAIAASLVPWLASFGEVRATEAAAAGANQFEDWVFEQRGKGVHKVCFVASPAKQLGAGPATRSDSVLYISAWPNDGIKSEISIKLGIAAKATAGAKVSIGREKFQLFIKDEHAFVADATQELKLAEAMKKAQKLKVQVIAEDGDEVIDTYSLSGLGAALEAQTKACR